MNPPPEANSIVIESFRRASLFSIRAAAGLSG